MAAADMHTLGVKALKALISSAGLSFDDCLEKTDLVARASKAQAMECCKPGFPRSGCRRACCVKQQRCDSADEDEQPSPAKRAKRQSADGGGGTRVWSGLHVDEPAGHAACGSGACDGFLLPSPPEPPAAFIAAKRAAHDRSQKARGPHVPSRMSGWGQREANALRHQVALASEYEASKDDARLAGEAWVATEKYDGIRAVWWPDGSDPPGFKGRNGNFINAPPPSLVALLPKDMRLDGELWAGRGRTFEQVSSLVGSKSLEGGRFHDVAWRSLTFMVFDAPYAGGGYTERLEKARARLADVIGERVRVVVPVACGNAAEKQRLLDRVTDAGGEGIVLRRAAATWRCGSERRDLLKVKRWHDAEAKVVEFRPAPRSENLPSLLCQVVDGSSIPRDTPRFELSWSRERTPPPNGAIVTFRYRQLQRDGKLSNARLVRVHDPASCDCFHCL